MQSGPVREIRQSKRLGGEERHSLSRSAEVALFAWPSNTCVRAGPADGPATSEASLRQVIGATRQSYTHVVTVTAKLRLTADNSHERSAVRQDALLARASTTFRKSRSGLQSAHIDWVGSVRIKGWQGHSRRCARQNMHIALATHL